MRVIPAIGLRAGACEQLHRGQHDPHRLADVGPIDLAREWARFGFRSLQLIDLDAARGHASNRSLVSDILAEHVSEIQVGGGVHDSDIIERHFADGAVRVILGARALEDANWLSDMAEIYPGALVVSVEARQGALTTHGSGHQKSRPLSDVVDDLASLPLGALLLTTVDAAGRECRPDPLTVEDVLERAGTLVHVATDASSISDLDALEDRGVSVAIVGLPLYSGALDPRDVAEAFGE